MHACVHTHTCLHAPHTHMFTRTTHTCLHAPHTHTPAHTHTHTHTHTRVHASQVLGAAGLLILFLLSFTCHLRLFICLFIVTRTSGNRCSGLVDFSQPASSIRPTSPYNSVTNAKLVYASFYASSRPLKCWRRKSRGGGGGWVAWHHPP
jgi:hypothetical protein